MEKIDYRDPKETKKIGSINQALEILNNAAMESGDEIRTMIDKDYKKIKETLSDIKPEIRGALNEIRQVSAESLRSAKEKVVDSTKEAAEKIDESAHRHPWYFIAASSALAAVLGFSLGRKSKHSS